VGVTYLDLQGLMYGWEYVTRENPLAPNHCILGTRTLFEAARRLGADRPRIVTVEALAMNGEAAGLVDRGIPVGEWPPSAWSVGAVTSAPGSGYPGHLVLIVNTDDGRAYLLDSSTGQFRREHKGLMVPGTLIVEVPNQDWPTDPAVSVRYDTPGWTMSWKWAPELGNLHRAAPDWRKGRRDHVDRVLEVHRILS
jgi:hypothetical protein